MPELNSAQTVCLAGLLLLSLVLPLMLGLGEFRKFADRKSFRKIVWGGQLLGAAAGLSIIVFPTGFLYATGLAVVSCFYCVCLLQKQIRLHVQKPEGTLNA